MATTLAVEWAFKLGPKIPPAKTTEAATNIVGNYERMVADISAGDKLNLLAETLKDLEKWYGTWNIAWGDLTVTSEVRTTSLKMISQACLLA